MLSPRVNLLVVDDDEEDFYITRRLLSRIERMQFAVDWAAGFDEGLAAIERAQHDVCLIDYVLGPRSGIDLLREATARGCRAPLILLTGQGDRDVDLQAMQAGAADYLVKIDIDADRLDRCIRYSIEQARHEEALQCARDETERMLDAIASILIAVDGDGRITRWNSTAERTFGIGSEQALGRLFSDSGILWHEPHVAERIIRSARKAEPLQFIDVRFISPTGEERFLGLTVNPIAGGDGQGGGLVILGMDITEKKLLQWQFQQSQKLEAVGALAGGVAHEFNNLLQAINGYTKYAMEGLSHDEQRYQDLQQIENAARRATVLTRQLLTCSRKHEIQMTQFGVGETLVNLEQLLKPVIGADITLEIRCADDTGTVLGDPDMLQQMLLNLCINAKDAMPSGGQLTIAAQDLVVDSATPTSHDGAEPGRYVLLTVADTGTGIPPEIRDRIFEPFYTTKEVGKGTGLGLSMVYGTVQQHGGKIAVESECGKGTTFKIYVPTVDSEVASDFEEEAIPVSGGSETILVAEDEQIVRDLTVRVLQQAGYTILATANGDDAVEMFEEHADAISLALLDVTMPKRSGHDVYQHMKARKAGAKAMFFTGYDPEACGASSVPDEEVRLIQKPIDPDALLRAIRGVLDEDVDAARLH